MNSFPRPMQIALAAIIRTNACRHSRAFFITHLVLIGGMSGATLLHAAPWADEMRDVHARFTGTPGTIARFGDSITQTQAFFLPLRTPHRNVSADVAPALAWLDSYASPEIWDWQTGATGAKSGTRSLWPLQVLAGTEVRKIDSWLESLNPEIAVIMWGTNDLPRAASNQSYADNMRDIVRTVKENGTIPILTTVPPRHGHESRAADFAEIIRGLAEEESVPLIDYYAETLARNPGSSWDGTLVYTGEGGVYQVETLVAGDGIHPSNPSSYRRDFSEEGLDRSGYTLRNYMTLLSLYDVYNLAIDYPGADFSGDGIVDSDDLHAWRRGLGTFTGATQAMGDADGDGDVDGSDLVALFGQFGEGQGPISNSLLASTRQLGGAAGVPEPSGVWLTVILTAITPFIVIARGTKTLRHPTGK